MSRHVVQISWDDAPHLTEEDKKDLLASIPVYQRDARTKGIPALGAGAIYPVQESEIVIKPIELPAFYYRAYALDVGWNRTAAIWGAWDRNTDTIFCYSEYYRGQVEPAVHAQAVQARGKWMTGAVDPASRGRSQNDGSALIDAYADLGLNLAPANNAVEAGIHEVYMRLSTGRLKIFSTLVNTLDEYRLYRRKKNGAILKENDHLMDCLRYLCMTKNEVFSLPVVETTQTQSRHVDNYVGY